MWYLCEERATKTISRCGNPSLRMAWAGRQGHGAGGGWRGSDGLTGETSLLWTRDRKYGSTPYLYKISKTSSTKRSKAEHLQQAVNPRPTK